MNSTSDAVKSTKISRRSLFECRHESLGGVFFFFPMSIPLKTTVMGQMRRQAQSVSEALITNAFLVNNYTWCFENRATKTCQSRIDW